jgi:hypothetical protein
MVSVLALGVVVHGFELWSGQNKALKKNGIWDFSAKHAELRSKSRLVCSESG